MAQFEDFYWTSPNGLQLHARDYAPVIETARLPVICLHGLTRNARDFEDVAPRIAAAGRRVLAADFRGRGQSDRAADPMSYLPPVYAGDIVAMMTCALIPQALFIGTSLGGLVTMIVAAMAPQAVGGSVLNDVGPRLSPVGLKRIGGYVGLPSDVADWKGAAAYAKAVNGAAFPHESEAFWDRFARRLFKAGADGRPVLDYDPGIAAPFKEVDPDLPAPDLTPLFAGLALGRPTLLVHGALSDLIDQERVDEMRELAPAMAYVQVPGVGHAPMLTEPAAWAAVEAWLDEAP
jgi:pimeloyl-ACP methyl ester carboxylesterase